MRIQTQVDAMYNMPLQHNESNRMKCPGLPKQVEIRGKYAYWNAYLSRDKIPNNVVCATSKGSDQPAHTRSLIRAFASRLNIL